MPIYGESPDLTYAQYLKIPELLDLQVCLSEPEAHDELQFIVVHQVYELWFKLVMHEIDAVDAALARGTDRDLRTAIRLCGRIRAIFGVLVGQIHVLETMRPCDFLKFRSRLNPASGFGSAQFRELECALGMKDARLVEFTKSDPRHERVVERLHAASLPDRFYALLAERGLQTTPPGPARSDEQEDTTLRSLKTIYDAPDDHPVVYELCEALIELDEQLVLWRRHHVMMVERQIGAKPGTGKGQTGDLDGIRYLRTTLSRRSMPDLWAVRTLLEE